MKITRVSALLLVTSLIINAAIAIVGPFFPPEAEKKGVDVNIIGYIFSVYPFSFVIVSLIVPRILHFYSRKTVFLAGSIVYAFSVIGFGLIIYLHHDRFLVWAFILRALQGGSNAAVYTTTYSVFSMQYEGHDIMLINSIFKSTIGAGMILGLGCGTLILMYFNYAAPFIAFGVAFLIYIPLVKEFFPSEITLQNQNYETNGKESNAYDFDDVNDRKTFRTGNNTGTTAKAKRHYDTPAKDSNAFEVTEKAGKRLDFTNLSNKKSDGHPIINSRSSRISSRPINNDSSLALNRSVSEAICSRTILKCLSLCIIFIWMLNFAPPILSKRLSQLKFHEYTYGMVFAIPCIVPIFSLLFANYLMQALNGNWVIIFGTLLLSAGFYIVSTLSRVYFLLGIGTLGFSAPFLILPLFPMMMSSIDKNEVNSVAIKNAVSGLYNAWLGIGAILGPIISANLYYYFDFEVTVLFLGTSSLMLAVVLVMFGCWGKVEKVQETNENFDLDIPDYSNMSFVKCEAVRIPMKSMRQFMDEENGSRSERGRVSDLVDFKDYANPDPLVVKQDK